MACDLLRLRMAVDAAREQIEEDWRQRYRIAGFKVPDRISEEEMSNEDLNAQARNMVSLIAAQFNGA
ncbi:hypothetical protein [Aureimonas sp. Leaf324]|uniref:hypothetical protein n=1 Tax=Aureimonas sp. Leaf324 TaxID=1736336 RepID=UPI0006F7B44A|nr:hypothetical protein [Aureimonas sp. Leaf324]KQQ81939.1 hypothetical protein ASF65_07745 [Aureimonas sp. Leaf324]